MIYIDSSRILHYDQSKAFILCDLLDEGSSEKNCC